MIKIRGLKKSFKENVVLNGIDVDIADGDIVAIIGPSGTGKSTFLRCINLLESPEAGEIAFNGDLFDYQTIAKDKDKRSADSPSHCFTVGRVPSLTGISGISSVASLPGPFLGTYTTGSRLASDIKP